MTREERLQALLELTGPQFEAVMRDRALAFAEARDRIEDAETRFPPEAVGYAVAGAQEVAMQRNEEASTAAEMRAAVLRGQIASLKEAQQ